MKFQSIGRWTHANLDVEERQTSDPCGVYWLGYGMLLSDVCPVNAVSTVSIFAVTLATKTMCIGESVDEIRRDDLSTKTQSRNYHRRSTVHGE